MYQPFLGANQSKILRKSSSKEKPGQDIEEPVESGLKIPIPRLGWIVSQSTCLLCGECVWDDKTEKDC